MSDVKGWEMFIECIMKKGAQDNNTSRTDCLDPTLDRVVLASQRCIQLWLFFVQPLFARFVALSDEWHLLTIQR